MQAKIEYISPAIATALLETNPVKNRARFKLDTVKRYTEDMAAGNWVLNGETIIVSESGKLVDGQHRLSAVIAANMTVPFFVVRGVSDEKIVFDTINTGKVRTASQVLGMEGVKNANVLSATLRWINIIEAAWRGEALTSAASTRSDLRDQRNILERHPAAPIVVQHYANLYLHRVFKSVVNGPFTLAAERYSYDFVADFMSRAASGAGLASGDPVLVLRERCLADRASNAKLPAIALAVFALRALAASYHGTSIKILRFSSAEKVPELV